MWEQLNRMWTVGYYHYWQTTGIQQQSQFGCWMSGLGQLSCSGEVKAVCISVLCASMEFEKEKIWGPFSTAEQTHTQGREKAE